MTILSEIIHSVHLDRYLFIKPTKCTGYKHILKYGLSLLLHVSACLCHLQGVHTLDLKLAGIYNKLHHNTH